MTLLEASGRVIVAPGEVRINLDTDFCRYYRKLLLEQHYESPLEFQTPKHGAHITVISRKIHPGVDTSCLLDYHDSVAEFKYDIDIRKGGSRFTTYYAYVECVFAEFAKRKVGVVDNKGFLGLHICVCNNKGAKYEKQDNKYRTAKPSVQVGKDSSRSPRDWDGLPTNRHRNE